MAEADRILAQHGLIVEQWSRWKLAKAIGAAFQKASLLIERAAQGENVIHDEFLSKLSISADVRGSATTLEASASTQSAVQLRPAKTLSTTTLFEAWWLEAKASGRKPSTRENYGNTIESFVSFLKHDDASRVTPEHVVAYKEYRLSTPSKRTNRLPSARTVKDTDLAALKTVFGWAVANHKLAINPASGVTVRVGKTQKLRSKGFAEQEAKKILVV